jgi:CRISPR-associated protein Csy2
MKFAGGDVLPSKSKRRIEIIAVDEDDDGEVKKLLKKLMVGYVLIERRDLIIQSQKEGKDALTALIDHLKVMHRASEDENGNVSWESKRQTAGWIVPIATGFQGISDVGFAKNQRDTQTPHRFAESVVTLGEFIMPYRVNQLNDMLWQYRVVADKNLYLCQTLSTLSILGDS